MVNHWRKQFDFTNCPDQSNFFNLISKEKKHEHDLHLSAALFQLQRLFGAENAFGHYCIREHYLPRREIQISKPEGSS